MTDMYHDKLSKTTKYFTTKSSQKTTSISTEHDTLSSSNMSVCLSVWLSDGPSVCLSVCLAVCVCVSVLYVSVCRTSLTLTDGISSQSWLSVHTHTHTHTQHQHLCTSRLAVQWVQWQRCLSQQQGYSTLSPVSTGMGHHLWADISLRYVTSQLHVSQLSLACIRGW